MVTSNYKSFIQGWFDPLLGWKSLLLTTADFLGGEEAYCHSYLFILIFQ